MATWKPPGRAHKTGHKAEGWEEGGESQGWRRGSLPKWVLGPLSLETMEHCIHCTLPPQSQWRWERAAHAEPAQPRGFPGVGHTEGSISPDFRCVSSEGHGEEAARTMETSSCNTSYSHGSDGVVEAQRGLVTCSKSCSKMAAARIQIQAPFPEVSYTPGKPSHCPDTSGHWVLVEESRRIVISMYLSA